HGSREQAAMPLTEHNKNFIADGKNESLVLQDSRTPGQFDLADKELAVLLQEVAKSCSNIVVILDCCHAASQTKGFADVLGTGYKEVPERKDPRPLSSYLGDYVAQVEQVEQGKELTIPAPPHLVLAACSQTEKAIEFKEGGLRKGLFVTQLLNVLTEQQAKGQQISYAELLRHTHLKVRQQRDTQTAQLEIIGNFDAQRAFLEQKRVGQARTFLCNYHQQYACWQVQCGFIHGLELAPLVPVELELVMPPATGSNLRVSLKTIDLERSFFADDRLDPQQVYRARIHRFRALPMPILLQKDWVNMEDQTFLEEHTSFDFSTQHQRADYALALAEDHIALRYRENQVLIQDIRWQGSNRKAALQVLRNTLDSIYFWHRIMGLRSRGIGRINPDKIDFRLQEFATGEERIVRTHQESLIQFCLPARSRGMGIRLQVRNRNYRPVYVSLLYGGQDFRIELLGDCLELAACGDFVTLWGDQVDDRYIHVSNHFGTAETFVFQLLVTSQRISPVSFVQNKIPLGQLIPSTSKNKGGLGSTLKTPTRDWFAKKIIVELVESDQQMLQHQDVTLAGGKLVVKQHSQLKAEVALVPSMGVTKSKSPDRLIPQLLEELGMSFMRFSSTKSISGAEALQIHKVQNEVVLLHNPLVIELYESFGEQEHLLPLFYDGEDVLPIGQVSYTANGASIQLHHIPDDRDGRTKSLGKALRLFFVKTVLKTPANQLTKIRYLADGNIKRIKTSIATLKNEARAARNIALCIHGILGDTAYIAQHLNTPQLSHNLKDQFDLVLAYDYENLDTAIETTATNLKKELVDLGLFDREHNPTAKLTIIAHSMGGLVARWLIESDLGGKEIVKALILAGTPNGGSAFAQLATYLSWGKTMLSWGLNLAKDYVPSIQYLNHLLQRRQQLTRTLAQMKRTAPIIIALSQQNDPKVPYLLIAGDTTDWSTAHHGRMQRIKEKLQLKVGNWFNEQEANDIAVTVESILAVDAYRHPAPRFQKVVCHHMNYFETPAVQQLMLEWLSKHLTFMVTME
ncbi:MAG: caspase family protein, partial [Bacteroidota bacterium]